SRRQANTARDAGEQLDNALGGECPQVLVDALAILQPQTLGNFPARWRQAAVVHETADESQHFHLPGRELWNERGHERSIPDGCLASSLEALAALCKYPVVPPRGLATSTRWHRYRASRSARSQ